MLDHSVILFDGGSGRIMAQWFDANGAPMTGEFEVIHNFAAGHNTWFETAPLVGNSVVVRRVDAPDSSERRTSQWLNLLPSGVARVEAAPEWLISRPNTQLQLIRSQRAYAALPTTQDLSSCVQKVDVISPSGNSCGTVSLAVDGSACTTRELRMARDGTLMQMLPNDREHDLTSAGARSCTMRFWPAALR